MEEKIKTNIPLEVLNTLKWDCHLFEFYKKDNEINLNGFLNTLIANYFEDFISMQKENINLIKEKALKYGIEGTNQEDFYKDVVNLFLERKKNYDLSENLVPLSFRPSKKNNYLFKYLEDNAFKNTTISEFFRILFINYTDNIQSVREKIIYKDVLSKLESSIKNKKKVYITTKRSKKNNEMIYSPYSIVSTLEQTFNYLIGISDGQYLPFRLNRIQTIIITNEDVDFTKDDLKLINRATRNGPQYKYSNNDPQVEIQLTEKGLKLYDSLYLYRPKYIAKKDNIFSFDCSIDNLINYFSRFGKECKIISPSSIQEKYNKFFIDTVKQIKS